MNGKRVLTVLFAFVVVCSISGVAMAAGGLGSLYGRQAGLHSPGPHVLDS